MIKFYNEKYAFVYIVIKFLLFQSEYQKRPVEMKLLLLDNGGRNSCKSLDPKSKI